MFFQYNISALVFLNKCKKVILKIFCVKSPILLSLVYLSTTGVVSLQIPTVHRKTAECQVLNPSTERNCDEDASLLTNLKLEDLFVSSKGMRKTI